MQNIIFRKSWLKTLNRWQPEQVLSFIKALDNFANDRPVEITDDRVMDLWDQVEPLLFNDLEKYISKVQTNKENGKKGGRPRKPNETQHNPTGLLENPNKANGIKNNPNNPKEKEREMEMEIDKGSVVQRDTSVEPTLHSDITSLLNPTLEDEEVFAGMFVAFDEGDANYEDLFDLWWKLPTQDQIDSITFFSNYIKWAKRNNKKCKLFYYLKDKKYNWASLRK